jgi:hypothetical protein
MTETRDWASEDDWRACEARLNALPQFTTTIEGVDIHLLHLRSPPRCWPAPSRRNRSRNAPRPRRSPPSDPSGRRHGGGGAQLVRAVRLHFTRRAEWSKPRTITPPLAP